MKNSISIWKYQIIMFIIMVIVGMLFNPMNILAYSINHLYISATLFYGGLLMASNMIWAHEIVHYLSMGKINIKLLLLGIILSIIISIFLLRYQFLVSDKEWLKRMISHHSTALTTSKKIKSRTKDKDILLLSENIIKTQEYEINLMKQILKKK